VVESKNVNYAKITHVKYQFIHKF